MKPLLASSFLALSVSAAQAGDVSGRIWLSDGGSAVTATVTLTCDSASTPYLPGEADANGFYWLRAPRQAPAGASQCSLSVFYMGQSSSTPLLMYTAEDSMTLNLELARAGGQGWSVIRK